MKKMATRKIPNKKPDYLRGAQLNHSASLRVWYEKKLRSLVKRMTDETVEKVLRLFRSSTSTEYFVAMDDSIASQAKILTNKLLSKFQKIFNDRASDLASSMVNKANSNSKKNLKTSVKKLADTLSVDMNFIPVNVKEVSKASIAENVSLIKSIPKQYFNQITGTVMRSITTGSGVDGLYKKLKKYGGMTDRRATNIALDQTRKAYNSINKERMLESDFEDFEWKHSGGGLHPRQEHIDRDGKVYSLKNLPRDADGEEDYPSKKPNCGCTMIPVYKFKRDDND